MFLPPLLSGVLHAISIHLPLAGVLGVVALAPLMFQARQNLGRSDRVKTALLYGSCYGLLTQLWVLDSAALIEGGLSGETALYFFGLTLATSIHGVASALSIHFVMRLLADRTELAVLVLPLALVFLEFLQMQIWLDTLPWVTLPIGYVLGPLTPLIQPAAIGGVWLVSYLAYTINCLLARAVHLGTGSSRLHLGAMLALWPLVGFWMQYLTSIERDHESLRVALLLDDVSHEPWSDANGNQRAERILSLASAIGKAGPIDLVLWSETAIPWIFQTDDDLVAYALRNASGASAYHFIGTKFEEVSSGDVYNAALLINSDGAISDMHQKTQPLPFLETEMLGFLATSRAGQSIKQAKAVEPITVKEKRLGVGICNEWMRASFARILSSRGAQAFVNLSNNNYFRWPMMKVQHLNYSRFRCVENRLAM
ncbi:MAG: apolipoprotein N-acyltransferase, partial [Bacteroidota bacterium]